MDFERREKRAKDRKLRKEAPPRMKFRRAEQFVKSYRQKQAQISNKKS